MCVLLEEEVAAAVGVVAAAAATATAEVDPELEWVDVEDVEDPPAAGSSPRPMRSTLQ